MSELKNIICIDDEADILELIKLTLETVGGYNVTVFQDSVSAVDCIEGYSPDMILIDGMMPHLNGIETMAAIRKIAKFEATPIVFMTARIQPKEQKEYLDKGAIGIIPKPFDPMELSEQIEKLWVDFNNT